MSAVRSSGPGRPGTLPTSPCVVLWSIKTSTPDGSHGERERRCPGRGPGRQASMILVTTTGEHCSLARIARAPFDT